MRSITQIVIHCSDTPNGRPQSVADIDKWHGEPDKNYHRDPAAVAKFNPGLKHIGYHYVIYVDGTVCAGRAEEEVGAHVKDHNTHSLGICLIGKDRFTPAQWIALKTLLAQKRIDYPEATIHGHCEYDSAKAQGKTCPNFNVQQYLEAGCNPAESWIYQGGKA